MSNLFSCVQIFRGHALGIVGSIDLNDDVSTGAPDGHNLLRVMNIEAGYCGNAEFSLFKQIWLYIQDVLSIQSINETKCLL